MFVFVIFIYRMEADLDTLNIGKNSKIVKKFDAGCNRFNNKETIMLSGIVIKINHVDKRQ